MAKKKQVIVSSDKLEEIKLHLWWSKEYQLVISQVQEFVKDFTNKTGAIVEIEQEVYKRKLKQILKENVK